MREIKFRAWDGKKMYYPHVFEFGVNGWNGETSMSFEHNGGMLTTSYIMQCAGQNDKNGNDIYEGDILKDEYDRIMLVEWHNSGFCFKAITETNFVWACNISQWFEGGTPPEIIGNEYDNPGLLEAHQ